MPRFREALLKNFNPRVGGSIPSLGTKILQKSLAKAGLFCFWLRGIENPRIVDQGGPDRFRLWPPNSWKGHRESRAFLFLAQGNESPCVNSAYQNAARKERRFGVSVTDQWGT
jgi:hypothetical protein